MEIESKILNHRLVEIKKKGTTVRLFFVHENKKKILRFDGLIFETTTSPINKKVVSVKDSRLLGIKSMSQLRYENKNPSDYKELLIKMGYSGSWKSEIICTYNEIRFE